MNHLNSLLIEGYMTAKPRQVIATKAENKKGKGVSLVKFTIASDRYYYNAKKELKVETLFIDVQAWGSLGESVLKFADKGCLTRVVGRLRPTSRQRQDGTVYESVEILARHIEYRKKRKDDEAEPSEDDPNLQDSPTVLEASDDDLVEEPISYTDYEVK